VDLLTQRQWLSADGGRRKAGRAAAGNRGEDHDHDPGAQDGNVAFYTDRVDVVIGT
jgi:hypothetical protein